MTEIDLIALVVGTILSFITQISKKFGIPPRLMVLFLCIAVAVGYSTFKDLVAPDTKEWAGLFVRDAMGTATLLYTIFGKQMDGLFNIKKSND